MRLRRRILSLSLTCFAGCVAEQRERDPAPVVVASADVASPRANAAKPAVAASAAPADARAVETEIEVGDAPFAGAQPSIEALGRAVVQALASNDRVALTQLAFDASEYKTRLFSAIARHPSAHAMGPDLLWDMHAGESFGHLQQALDRLGGQPLEFIAVEVRDTEAHHGLVFHKKPVLRVRDADGQELRLGLLGTIVEHPASGGFKLLSFRDVD